MLGPSLVSDSERGLTPGTPLPVSVSGRRPSAVASFIKSEKAEESSEANGRLAKQKLVALQVVQSTWFSNCMAVVVLLDAYSTCSDVDARAAGGEAPIGLKVLSDTCLGLYSAELVALLLLKGWVILKDWMTFTDAVIIFCGYLELLLPAIFPGENFAQISILRLLRLMRVARLMRLLRKIRSLRELHKLVTMMATCMKALIWSFIFCFAIMTVWALLTVEVVHPLIQELYAKKVAFQDCEECLRAASSVMSANLLLFKTVIAGDSWGRIAVPVIEAYPATACIFVGSLLTLVFGVLNLIVAVVVDTFAETRERDMVNKAVEMDQDLEDDQRFLQRVFDRIDVNMDGRLTLEELMEGARKDPELQSRLRVMDIDEVDLEQLFEMLDTCHEGSVDTDTLVTPLSRWVHDSKTAARFIKYNVARTMMQQEELYDFSRQHFNFLATRVEYLSLVLDKLTTQPPAAPAQDAQLEMTPMMTATDSAVETPRPSTIPWVSVLVEEAQAVALKAKEEIAAVALRAAIDNLEDWVRQTSSPPGEESNIHHTDRDPLRMSLILVENALQDQLKTQKPDDGRCLAERARLRGASRKNTSQQMPTQGMREKEQ